MVESTAHQNDPLNLRQNEKHFGTQLMHYWTNREQYPLLRTAEDGNMVLRQVEENGEVTMLVEYKNIPGLTPDDFKPFINDWDKFT